MERMVYKCAPENAEKLDCVNLKVNGSAIPACDYYTEHGYCSRVNYKGGHTIKQAMDRLGLLEDMGGCSCGKEQNQKATF